MPRCICVREWFSTTIVSALVIRWADGLVPLAVGEEVGGGAVTVGLAVAVTVGLAVAATVGLAVAVTVGLALAEAVGPGELTVGLGSGRPTYASRMAVR